MQILEQITSNTGYQLSNGARSRAAALFEAAYNARGGLSGIESAAVYTTNPSAESIC